MALSIIIIPGPPAVSTASLPSGTQNVAYSTTLAATGGTTPLTWSITVGTLPTGLTLTAATGVISGTPTVVGTSNFTVTVTDSAVPVRTATKALSITINAPLTITTASLPSGPQNAVYSTTLAATGGVTAYAWSISVGTLPTGLSLNAATGAITGTPTVLGTSSFTVMVTDSTTPVNTATKALSITISATMLTITTASLPAVNSGVAYSQTLVATGGTNVYTWSISAGGLPPGLTLNAATGLISGTTNVSITGTFNFTVTVTDNATPTPNTATKALSIVANPPGLLRVQTVPPVPTTISINGNPSDDWALNWVEMSPGTYTLSFSGVTGWATPTSVSVAIGTAPPVTQPLTTPITVTSGLTTTVTANFTQLGNLHVVTSPATPATISINGNPVDDWACWTNILPGSYTVSFESIAGFLPPAPQTVTVTAGATTTVTGTYLAGTNVVTPPATGLLRVQTSPAASSTISLNGIQRDDWALNWLKLAPGAYTLSLTDVIGLKTPTTISVSQNGAAAVTQPISTPLTIVAGQTTVVTANFTIEGNLRIETSPPINTPVFVNGSPMDNWSAWTEFVPGTYTVSFGTAVGFALTPPPLTVTVTAGATTHVVGNYNTGTTAIVVP
jgi:hypothetical protein